MLSTRITAIPVGLSDSLERKVISRLDGRLETSVLRTTLLRVTVVVWNL
jgi:hypothetical protein